MVKNPLKVILDTNVLISSILFGGKPRKIIKHVQEGNITPIISPVLLAELIDVLVKKFQFAPDKLLLVEDLIKENFMLVNPSITISIISDKDDNRVLEAAIEGGCNYIVSGDQDLLKLKSFQNVKIVTPDTFLSDVFDN